MKLFKKLIRKIGFGAQRAFSGAVITRLNNWVMANVGSADKEIFESLKKLRSHSRELSMNDSYMKKYLTMLVTNIVGSKGIKLQAKSKKIDGTLDKEANKQIEVAWKAWGKTGLPTVCGKHSWIQMQALVLKSVARDGEAIVRIVRGFDNPFKFSLQLIEADHLDELLNQTAAAGKNKISMGVEYDKWDRPLAYHILISHPGEVFGASLNRKHERILARDIIHIFSSDRIGQSRGIPWNHTILTTLKMLNGYLEAMLVGARAAACKMGIITSDDNYVGDGKDHVGNIKLGTSPGELLELKPNQHLTEYDPKYPNANLPDFVKAILRNVAGGLGVAYNSFASDLEGVNFSSIRQGALEERDQWKMKQVWFIEQFHEKVYNEWLRMALLTKQLNLPISKIDKFKEVLWQPRGFGWVDPLKDIKAIKEAIDAGLGSRTLALALQGLDMEDVIEMLRFEQELAEKAGIDISIGKQNEGDDAGDKEDGDKEDTGDGTKQTKATQA